MTPPASPASSLSSISSLIHPSSSEEELYFDKDDEEDVLVLRQKLSAMTTSLVNLQSELGHSLRSGENIPTPIPAFRSYTIFHSSETPV